MAFGTPARCKYVKSICSPRYWYSDANGSLTFSTRSVSHACSAATRRAPASRYMASRALPLVLHALPPLQVLLGTPSLTGPRCRQADAQVGPLLALELRKVVQRSSTR